ncbi:MAG: hypothetical protein K2Q22_08645, partial [Cytophagales bacterium]|nr:hypothetical protein [Cytophagales bacterium]
MSFYFESNPMRSLVLGMVFLLITSNHLSAQVDACGVVGWASQNGGVTGGGSATPTVVANYTDLKAAITNT